MPTVPSRKSPYRRRFHSGEGNGDCRPAMNQMVDGFGVIGWRSYNTRGFSRCPGNLPTPGGGQEARRCYGREDGSAALFFTVG